MKYYITFTVLFCSFSLFSQQKDIHFIHGLNANPGTWEDLEEEFENNCANLVQSTNGDYDTDMGLINMADEINTELNTLADHSIPGVPPYVPASQNDICIAHSMGGVALRHPNANPGGANFGGIITVGSPHDGAGIARSVRDGSLDIELDFACQTLTVDIVDSYENLVNTLGTAITFGIWNPNQNWLNDAFCDDGAGGGAVPAIIDLSGADASNITLDDMGGLNNTIQNLGASTVPSVEVVSTIPSPVHWNFLNDIATDFIPMVNGGFQFGNVQLTQGQLQFIVDEFSDVEDNIDRIETLSTSLALFHNTLANWTPFWMPQVRRAHTRLSRDLFDATRWIRTSEGVWNQLIGAAGNTQLVQVSGPSWAIDASCACWCDGQPVQCGDTPCGPQEPGPPDDECQNTNPDPNNPCWMFVPAQFAEVVVSSDESDGFITASSQRLPGAWGQERITASHVAESTSGEMWGVVQQAITPGQDVHPVFRIPGCNIQ